MTSDGISTGDWDRVHELALEIVNADDDEQADRVRKRMVAYLDDLTRRYGELPSLCATKADYVDQPAESERLLLRAFDLAVTRNDAPNIRSVSLSLAQLYSTDLLDVAAASQWLEIARANVDPADESDAWEINQIVEAIAAARQRESNS